MSTEETYERGPNFSKLFNTNNEIGIREFAKRAGVTYDYAAKMCVGDKPKIKNRPVVLNNRVVARLIPVSEVERYKKELKRKKKVKEN